MPSLVQAGPRSQLSTQKLVVSVVCLVVWGSIQLTTTQARSGETSGNTAPASAAASSSTAKPILEIPGATAKTAAEMKPYTDVISGVEVKFEMVPIPGGKFTMGSPDGEASRKDDEGPQVEVEVEPFWMGKHEVTWDEYDVFMTALDFQARKALGNAATENDKLADALAHPTLPYGDPTWGMGKQGGYPAVNMTHFAARMYCKWLSAKTGRYYRLPTEAEWEYACRAGTNTAYSFGDDAEKLGDYAWYFDNSNDKYQKVGKKKPNPWGLCDMHGNVAEWTLDQYVPNFYAQLKEKGAVNPLSPPAKKNGHSVRGGSWNDDAEALRSAARLPSNLEDWQQQDPQIPKSVWGMTDGHFVGFRVVRPLREPSAEELQQKWDVGLAAEGEDGEFYYPAEEGSSQKSKRREEDN